MKDLQIDQAILPINLSVNHLLLGAAYEEIETSFSIKVENCYQSKTQVNDKPLDTSASETDVPNSFTQAIENHFEKEGCIT